MNFKTNLFLSRKQIESAETLAFSAGMPVEALMEKAGILLAARIISLYPVLRYKNVVVFAGPGHNGGDAWVVARELFLSGYCVTVVEFDSAKQRPLTAKHASFFKSLGGFVTTWPVLDTELISASDFYVDGLMGFGLNRSFESAIIETVNASGKPIVSIDIPSGLHADEGLIGPCIKATRTLCLQFFKNSFCFDREADFIGDVECIDLGIQTFAPIELVAENCPLLLLPTRTRSAHKYSSGKVSLIAGSQQYKGAGVLCALACRETGAGYITLVTPAHETIDVLKVAPDVVLSDVANLKHDACVLIGSGLPESVRVESWLTQTDETVVLDAAALQASLVSILKKRAKPAILTPHAGEFSKMFPHLIHINKLDAACQAAREANAIVVLKGPRTVIASPCGKVRVQMRATPALARAGTGDVLAGLITGLVPQFSSAFEAACFAVGWHAAAACDLETKLGTQAVNALALIHHLGHVLVRETV